MKEKTSWTQEERKAIITFVKGTMTFEKKDYDIAKIFFKKALEMDSNQYKSHLMLVQIYLNKDEKNKVLFHLQKVISINESCKERLLENNTFKAFFEDEKLKV